MIQGPWWRSITRCREAPAYVELDRPTEPTLVIVDDAETEGLAELLSGALVTHATAVRSAA